MTPDTREPVLFLESRLAHGGDVQVLFDILRALDTGRFAPIVACVPDGPVARHAMPAGVELVPLGFGTRGASRIGRTADLLGTVSALRRLVRARGIRVVHSNNTRRTLTVAVMLALAVSGRIALVYHAHCEPQSSLAHRLALRRASRVWAVSRFIAGRYREAGVPEDRIAVLPNGYDFAAAFPTAGDARSRLGIPSDAPCAVLVGRLAPNKGQALAVEALAAGGLPGDLHLVFVGDDAIADRNAGYREGLLARAAELGCEARVHLVGFVADPKPYYAMADVVLIPSHREPFGLTALEAGAAAKPIVATEGGGLTEILGETAGLPMTGRTPAALAARLALVLEQGQDPSPQCVRQRLADTYGREAFAMRLHKELELMSRRSRPETTRSRPHHD